MTDCFAPQYYDMPSPSMRNALHAAMAADRPPFKAGGAGALHDGGVLLLSRCAGGCLGGSPNRLPTHPPARLLRTRRSAGCTRRGW